MQTSQTGGLLYSDTHPYEVSEFFLRRLSPVIIFVFLNVIFG